MPGWVLPLMIVALAGCAGGRPAPGGDRCPIEASDLAEIRKLVSDYRASWLSGDASAVLGLFTDDGVLLPHHGDAPVVGRAAIEKFWWPRDAPPFRLLRMEVTVDEVGGNCGLAFARGIDEIAWSGGGRTRSQRGTYLNVFRKTAGGWKISHHMWDDPVAQVE